MAKKELVKLTIVGEESTGILHEGEFVGVDELLIVDEETAQELIRRGRAKKYVKSSGKKKVDKKSEPEDQASDSSEDQTEDQQE